MKGKSLKKLLFLFFNFWLFDSKNQIEFIEMKTTVCDIKNTLDKIKCLFNKLLNLYIELLLSKVN